MKVDDLIPKVWPTQTAMAEALGVTKGAISQWAKSGIPELRVYQLREVLNRRASAQTEAAA